MKVTVRWNECSHRWVVSKGRGRNRRRAFFTTRKEAEAVAADWREAWSRAGNEWLALSSSERNRLVEAYHVAKELGIDLLELIYEVAGTENKGPQPSNRMRA